MLIPSDANYKRYLYQCKMIKEDNDINIEILEEEDDYIKHLYKLVSEYGNKC